MQIKKYMIKYILVNNLYYDRGSATYEKNLHR